MGAERADRTRIVTSRRVVFVANAGSGTIDCTAFALTDDDVVTDAVWQLDVVRHTDPQTVSVTACGNTIEFEARSGDLSAAVAPALPMLWTSPTAVVDGPESIRAVGHRIVHGGDADGPSKVDGSTIRHIRRQAKFAPLHNPPGLELIDLVDQTLPQAAAVAVFDTSFHRSMPKSATVFGGPVSWFDEGLRRYGFHGISHEDVATRAARLLDAPLERLEMISVHLGGGCSATAVRGGRSVDTTMGLTPDDGMVMATRIGSVDPGLLVHLMRRDRLDVDGLEDLVSRRSGLMGLTGDVTGDIGRIHEAAEAGDRPSVLARDVYVRSVAREIAGVRTSLDGLDAIVFTGGATANAPAIRSLVADRLGHLGVRIDDDRNRSGASERLIGPDDAEVASIWIEAGENRWIADATIRTLRSVDGAEPTEGPP